MLFKPLLGTDLSGKVGGIVASHNAGGAYFKAATIPTNPNTIQQQAVRTIMSALTVAWNSTLSAAERLAWEVYAVNVKLTNRIGEQVNVSGLSMFIRSNVARQQIGVDAVIAAPTTFNLGQLAKAQATGATEAGQTISIAFGATIPVDPWISEAGSWLAVYVSKPQNASINFFKGPYRVAGSLQGDPTPPASPLVVTVPFAITAGQRLFTRSVVTYADGRFTSAIRDNAIVGA